MVYYILRYNQITEKSTKIDLIPVLSVAVISYFTLLLHESLLSSSSGGSRFMLSVL